MALAGCPDSFLRHPYYKDQVEQTPPLSPRDLAGPGFPAPPDRLTNHQEDDVDLEALVNDVNASLESLYPARGMQSETVPLLQNGQHARGQPPASGTRALQAQRSQPVHILAVRRLQEEDQQLRTSSLPAIPNPFPELCGPGSPPVLTRGSLPPSQAAAKQVSTRPWFERQAAWLWGQDGCAGSFLWEEGRGSVWDLLSSFFSSCYCPLTL
nr:growth factor receptor-bound protein 10-like isoform X4 [Halichoerus grypus]XP_035958882.1 growth factor receptor-bound protein 10-like isoform X4 [Halichoerus grypus]XP_035958883.1 growth factor receptor-bound protein 10-like isoform X4 [Halichoerus grypus]